MSEKQEKKKGRVRPLLAVLFVMGLNLLRRGFF